MIYSILLLLLLLLLLLPLTTTTTTTTYYYLLLPTTYYYLLPPTTYYLLPTTYYLLSYHLSIVTPPTLRKAESNCLWRCGAVPAFASNVAGVPARCHFYGKYGTAPERAEVLRGLCGDVRANMRGAVGAPTSFARVARMSSHLRGATFVYAM